ncbi:MAG TPA: SNF2-related protein [Candidatus Binatia bacterium]|nr:SNF2-related protein [Candidatus Binatia bacterium]
MILVNPFEKDPDETYRAYQRFRKRNEYDKAYRCIENLLKRFPDDMELLEEIVALTLGQMRDPDLARPWLMRRIKLASYWRDYALLSEIEAVSGNLTKARENLGLAMKLQKRQRFLMDTPREVREALDRARNLIRLQEDNRWVERISSPSKVEPPRKQVGVPVAAAKLPAVTEEKKQSQLDKSEAPVATALPVVPALVSYRAALRFAPPDFEVMNAMLQTRGTLKECQLRVEYAHLEVERGFDDLLCVNAIKGVDRYWYQLETAKKVLKYFLGRVLLCDEVGLGKTIEAGMLMKEYLLRGMVKNILILTPAPLVSQWQEEMAQKFGIVFATTDDPLFGADPDRFWRGSFIIASIHTAKSSKHFARVAGNFYDLVVVDEAHHLKNRNTLNWKLVNEIKKRFIFLLTATPMQNNLIELFNLITLLKPGQFKTERLFRQAYMQRRDTRRPANKEQLRELLRDVMIRNTRSVIDLKLPRRFATTARLEPNATERQLYEGISEFSRARSDSLPAILLQLLLREAGSSPAALRATLLRLRSERGESVDHLLGLTENLEETAREKALLEILSRNPEEKKVVFVQYLKTLDSVASLLERRGLPFALFCGDLSAREKDEAIRRFREDLPILLSTESGGEGRNLQFCNTLINFDLPWNPMRIEQRIGRLHRIGQRRDVFIFNLSVRETLEDHILHILEDKINMFEMVIGEIEPLLGYLGEEREFEDIVMEIWMGSRNHEEAGSRFEVFGQDLVKAKADYLESKELDREIFGEDYEV